jgi:hypothetical protein
VFERLQPQSFQEIRGQVQGQEHAGTLNRNFYLM